MSAYEVVMIVNDGEMKTFKVLARSREEALKKACRQVPRETVIHDYVANLAKAKRRAA